MFGEAAAYSNTSKSKSSSHSKRKRSSSSGNKGGKISKRNAMTETTLDSEHIFLTQEYKDEILELQKKCFEKERIILERDKKEGWRFVCPIAPGMTNDILAIILIAELNAEYCKSNRDE